MIWTRPVEVIAASCQSATRGTGGAMGLARRGTGTGIEGASTSRGRGGVICGGVKEFGRSRGRGGGIGNVLGGV